MRLTVLVALVCLTGCAHEAAVEERAFEACYSYVRTKTCGGYDQAQRDPCMSKVGDRYTSVSGTASRRAMLVDSGCPAPVVDGVLNR